MKLINKLLPALISLAAIFMHARPALADTGPKPTMDFQLQFESGVDESAIVSGILHQCNESDCRDAATLEELGPQGLYCETQACRAIGYGFAPYSMLELEFTDGVTRRSNIFEQTGFDSYYTVHVRPDDLFVEPRISAATFPAWGLVLIACLCMLAGAGLIAGMVVFLRRRARA